tara:strand:- start:901 stop:1239 length:339 start_codon:yes stop_codon:yes gene_type:complete
MSKRISKMLFSKERVELGLVDDFESEFEKTVNNDLKIGQTLISALGKAETKYKAIINDYESVIKIAEQAESAAKDLGVDLPNTFKNKIASSKEGVNEAQNIINKINQLYSLF